MDASAPFVDRNGVPRTPSCSGAPEAVHVGDAVEFVEAPTDYSFFYRDGDPKKLVIAFDGGGACWDSLTCLSSLIASDKLYNTYVDETVEELETVGGLVDKENPENPISDYMQVFIPYCTGDLHIGSKDTLYEIDTPAGTVSATIHHRGYDNVVAVLEWIDDYYKSVIGAPPEEVLVLGASAGGYGAFYGYPAIDEMLPASTRKRVLIDSANAIVNQDFYDRALTTNGVWGIWENMPPQLANAFAAGPDTLSVAINQDLGWNYPLTRFGQYTRAFDTVQILYLHIAKNLHNPAAWTNPWSLLWTTMEWTLKARISMETSASTTPNYRYYLGEGFEHTTVADPSVYLDDSGSGIRLIDWIDDMLSGRFLFGSDWRNATCYPNCVP